ncbi:MAG: hypothetical protein GY854_32040 [Deltaproteobacteria bacterium]|nr:hypothetical protein [Deltaproteobacteria bacterium]
MKRVTCIALILGFGLTLTAAAEAKTKKELTYRYSQIWSTAIRLLRVDKGFPLIEKDKKAGYILFEYREGDRKFTGSLEIVPAIADNKHIVSTRLRIANMPSYVEMVLLDKLLYKLKEEYGAPPPARPVETKLDKQGKPEKGKNNAATGKEPPDNEDEIEVDEEKLEDAQEE